VGESENKGKNSVRLEVGTSINGLSMCGPNINEKEERSKKSCMDFNETRVREAGEGAKKEDNGKTKIKL